MPDDIEEARAGAKELQRRNFDAIDRAMRETRVRAWLAEVLELEERAKVLLELAANRSCVRSLD